MQSSEKILPLPQQHISPATDLNELCFSVVGGVNAPEEVLNLGTGLGYTLARRGMILRSVGAEGLSEAFERGAAHYENEASTISRETWVPYRGMRTKEHFDYRHQYSQSMAQRTMVGNLLQRENIVQGFYQLDKKTQHLLTALHYTVTGEFEAGAEPELAHFLLYWAEDEMAMGVYHAVLEVASRLGIPAWNLADRYQCDNLCQVLNIVSVPQP